MLNIAATHAQQGKVSNNIENHGDVEVKAFDIPFALEISREQFNAIVEDPYADRWLFNAEKDVLEPNASKFEPLKFSDQFEGATICITMSSGDMWEFQDCRIKDLTFEARRGGVILLGLKARVRPDGQAALDLLDHQHESVKIEIRDAKVMLKGGGKQQEMPLATAGEGEQPEQKAEELTHPSQLFDEPKKRKGKANGEKRAH